MPEEYQSYACYFRLTPRHKWDYHSQYHTAERNKVIAHLHSLLAKYHKFGNESSYALILQTEESTINWPSLWTRELLAVPQGERWIIHYEPS